jgi:hypothetical protein
VSPFARARSLLDEVQGPAQLESFESARFAALIAEETPPVGRTLAGLGEVLDALRGLFGDVERFVEKAMRIRLHQLPEPLPPQLRTLLSSTIGAYARDPGLLGERVGAIVTRLRRAADAEPILDAARRTLEARAALRQAILEAARRVAGDCTEVAKKAARDRSQPDEERERWGKARTDLLELAARGEVLEEGGFEERLARRTPIEEVEQDPAVTRFSLIEID